MRSLRARLGLSAALVVAAVVGLTTFLLTGIVGRTVEAEALDAAAAIALGVSADLGEHAAGPTTTELEGLLGDYSKAVPTVRSLTVTAGIPATLVASTEAPFPPRAVSLGEDSVRRGEIVTYADDPVGLHFVAVPLDRRAEHYGAVVVAVGMEPLRRVQRQSRLAAAVFAGAAIALLVVALDLVARRLVHRPLRTILDTMRCAATGDMAVRAPQGRADEIGAVAAGLNAMLDRTASFNETLRKEVERATSELREANRQLIETAQRLFATRRELARAEQLALSGQMAASVAHQVGTPLNLVSGYVQMLRADPPAGPLAAERLQLVQEQIGRVTAIVQSFLDGTRRPPLALAPVAPSRLVTGVAELARPALLAAGIQTTVETNPDMPEVAVDAGQIEQALLNLVTNAIDAMPHGGRLTLAARLDPEGMEISVADTGRGIPSEDLTRVFEPLVTTKPFGHGTGLGLPIAREIVEAHGGTLQLQSDPDQGTTAIIRLPRAGEGH